MVASSTSSASSSVSSISSISFSDEPPKPPSLKFLCSYAGRILPRFPDGRLRYVGGVTRVLAVPRSISFQDLMERMGEVCGWGDRVTLRCQIPTEDLDALVTVTSDEDLANLLEEYELADRERTSARKIRAFLFPSSPSPLPPGGSGSPKVASLGVASPSLSSPARSPPKVKSLHAASPPRYPRHHRHRHVCAGPAIAYGHPPRVHLVGHW